MKKLCWVGVDISAKELVVVIERDGRKFPSIVLSNEPEGHRKLIALTTKRGWSAQIVMESTGVYGLDLALALHRAKRIEVMVANPRAVSQFAGAYLQRSKNDALDAGVLLEFAKRMPFKPWSPPAPEVLDLRSISRRIESLTKTAAQEKNRRHASSQSDERSEVVHNDIEVNLRHLERRIDRLRQQALELIGRHADLALAFGLLTSIKGIAEAAGIQLLAELFVLPDDMTVRQWVAHAGLDPREFQSGSSVHKPARISKKGNTHLRRALFMPALVAIRWEPNVEAYYRKLLGRGKTKMQANVAVMRKLLHAIYGMLKNGEKFNGEKFFAIRT